MGLCGGFSLLLKRQEMMLNEFSDGFVSESGFYLVFSGVIYTKISGIFSDEFYDKKNRFYDEKIDFLRKKKPETQESRVRRPGSLE